MTLAVRPEEIGQDFCGAIVTESVNISVYPEDADDVDTATERTTTYGDMHGNAMKVLWSLIRCGAAWLDKKDKEAFSCMWMLYNNVGWPAATMQNTQLNLKNFNELLARVKFKEGASVRFLGDLLADRGQSDILTLQVLAAAKQNGVILEIIQSNHDNEFQCRIIDQNKAKLNGDQARSVESVEQMIAQKAITREQVLKLYDEVYDRKNGLKLVSYELILEDDKINVFIHAPNTLDVIWSLGQQMAEITETESPPRPNTAIDLAVLIDYINFQYSNLTVQQLKNLCNSVAGKMDSAYEKLLWNRITECKFTKTIPFKYQIHCGHDSGEISSDLPITLYDDVVGKAILPASLGIKEDSDRMIAEYNKNTYKIKWAGVAIKISEHYRNALETVTGDDKTNMGAVMRTVVLPLLMKQTQQFFNTGKILLHQSPTVILKQNIEFANDEEDLMLTDL